MEQPNSEIREKVRKEKMNIRSGHLAGKILRFPPLAGLPGADDRIRQLRDKKYTTSFVHSIIFLHTPMNDCHSISFFSCFSYRIITLATERKLSDFGGV
jgi:hypothetical protein